MSSVKVYIFWKQSCMPCRLVIINTFAKFTLLQQNSALVGNYGKDKFNQIRTGN